ncbi:MAG: hypothetical protein WC046_05195 [Candidatus Bathyarchaeia archaeon]
MSMLGCFRKNTCCKPAVRISSIILSSNMHADTLKYGYIDALAYNKCKLAPILEAALTEKVAYGVITA